MRQHLSQIAQRTKPGRHAVVVMNGAGWHTADIADEFSKTQHYTNYIKDMI